MFKYFLQKQNLTKISKFVLCFILMEIANCMTWQTIVIPETQNIPTPLTSGKKKVTILIPIKLKMVDCNPKIFIDVEDYTILPELLSETLLQRGFEPYYIGVPTNFGLHYVIAGIPTYKTFDTRTHSGTTYNSQGHEKWVETTVSVENCEIVSEEVFAKYQNELRNPNNVYRSKLKNVSVDSEGKAFVELNKVGKVKINFHENLDKKKAFYLKIQNPTLNDPEIIFKITAKHQILERSLLNYLNRLLTAFSIGLIPAYEGQVNSTISINEVGTTHLAVRNIKWHVIEWLPLILTFNTYYETYNERIEKIEKAVIPELLDDIGLK